MLLQKIRPCFTSVNICALERQSKAVIDNKDIIIGLGVEIKFFCWRTDFMFY